MRPARLRWICLFVPGVLFFTAILQNLSQAYAEAINEKRIDPCVLPAIAVEFLAQDETGAPLPGALFEVDGVPVLGETAQIPERFAMTLSVVYGVSEKHIQIPEGLSVNETVTVDVASGDVQSATTPGHSRVIAVVQPGSALFRSYSMTGEELYSSISWMRRSGSVAPITPGAVYDFAQGAEVRVKSEFGGLSKQTLMSLTPRRDYQIAIHGGRVWAIPHAPGAPAHAPVRVSFFHAIRPVHLRAIDALGELVSVEMRSQSVGSPLNGALPMDVPLSLSSTGFVRLGMNGFFKTTEAIVLEDNDVVRDLATDEGSSIYSFQNPKLTWKVGPLLVRFDAVDEAGASISAQVGVDEEGRPSGAAPYFVTLLEGTGGSVFVQRGSDRVSATLNIRAGMIHSISVASGAVSFLPSDTEETVVRFVFP